MQFDYFTDNIIFFNLFKLLNSLQITSLPLFVIFIYMLQYY